MINPPKITVSISVGGASFDPAQLTSLLGVSPTQVHRKSRALCDRADVPELEWILEVNSAAQLDINDVLRELLVVVWPRREALVDYAKKHELSVSFLCSVNVYDEAPAFYLGKDEIVQLGFLGADFGIDVQDY